MSRKYFSHIVIIISYPVHHKLFGLHHHISQVVCLRFLGMFVPNWSMPVGKVIIFTLIHKHRKCGCLHECDFHSATWRQVLSVWSDSPSKCGSQQPWSQLFRWSFGTNTGQPQTAQVTDTNRETCGNSTQETCRNAKFPTTRCSLPEVSRGFQSKRCLA